MKKFLAIVLSVVLVLSIQGQKLTLDHRLSVSVKPNSV